MKYDKPVLIGLVLTACAVLYGSFYSRNEEMKANNIQIDRAAYRMVSYTTSGPSGRGHVEYVRYQDGSQDVLFFPSNVNKRIELDQDPNGDGTVERIRENQGSGAPIALLVRTYDYDGNRAKFNAADKQLRELMRKYSR